MAAGRTSWPADGQQLQQPRRQRQDAATEAGRTDSPQSDRDRPASRTWRPQRRPTNLSNKRQTTHTIARHRRRLFVTALFIGRQQGQVRATAPLHVDVSCASVSLTNNLHVLSFTPAHRRTATVPPMYYILANKTTSTPPTMFHSYGHLNKSVLLQDQRSPVSVVSLIGHVVNNRRINDLYCNCI